jgi:hypothetical protein
MKQDFDDFYLEFKDQAIFLPSLQIGWVKAVSSSYAELRPDFSPSVLNSTDMLNFLLRDALFYYPWALYSAGIANLDIEKAKETERAIHNRVRKRDGGDTLLIVDSGGFQVVTGALEINGKSFDWDNPDEGRMKILRWQEEVGDVATVLDIPTFATKKNTRFKTFKDCLDQTNDNLRFIRDNRENEGVKFINVLQGDTNTDIKKWYEGVKWFPNANGWAVAGGVKMNLYNLLRTIILLWKDGGLEGEKGEYLHVLGVGKPAVGAVLTIIQKVIRDNINPDTLVTLDASNPHLIAGKFGTVILHYELSNSLKATKPVKKKFEEVLPYLNPNDTIPDAWGPVLKTSGIPAKDIFVQNANGKFRNIKDDGKRASDTLAYGTMMAHNTFMIADEFLTNNQILVDMETDVGNFFAAVSSGEDFETATERNFMKISKLINKIFKSKHPRRELDKRHQFFRDFIIWEPR